MGRRFETEHDTPCPFRMARFGYKRTGEFVVPGPEDLYIVPTEGPRLQEHEPVIAGKDGRYVGEPRHIVVALNDETQDAMADPRVHLIHILTGLDPAEILTALQEEADSGE